MTTDIKISVLKLNEYRQLEKVSSAPISEKDFLAGNGEQVLRRLIVKPKHAGIFNPYQKHGTDWLDTPAKPKHAGGRPRKIPEEVLRKLAFYPDGKRKVLQVIEIDLYVLYGIEVSTRTIQRRMQELGI